MTVRRTGGCIFWCFREIRWLLKFEVLYVVYLQSWQVRAFLGVLSLCRDRMCRLSLTLDWAIWGQLGSGHLWQRNLIAADFVSVLSFSDLTILRHFWRCRLRLNMEQNVLSQLWHLKSPLLVCLVSLCLLRVSSSWKAFLQSVHLFGRLCKSFSCRRRLAILLVLKSQRTQETSGVVFLHFIRWPLYELTEINLPQLKEHSWTKWIRWWEFKCCWLSATNSQA